MLPITDQSAPSADVRFLNYFDWTSNSNIQLQNMQTNQNMFYLHNASAPYYSYIYEGEKMTNSNGWELLLMNTGFHPDLSDNPDGQSPEIPYIVLYNKFTGVLRVFASYGDGQLPTGISFDGVVVSIEFDEPEKVNGVLRLKDGIDKPLDKKTSVLRTQSLAFHPNSPGDWFSADFQLTFDPCICYYPANLRLRFDFLESLDLTLYGRSITIEDELADGNSLLTNNFLTNFEFNGTATEDQIVMYKVMGDFVDDYLERLEKYKSDLADVNEHNAEVEKKLATVKLFKKVVVEGGAYTVGALTGQPWFGQLVTYANHLVPPISASPESIKKYKKKLDAEAKKALSKQADLFIKKNFSKKPKPKKPDAPVASFTEMNMSGVIQNSTEIYGARFFTPGSYGSQGTGTPQISNPLEYPIYNNSVGTFALLNSPKIKASRTRKFQDFYEYTDYDNGYSASYTSWKKFMQFQLDSPLYYAINEAADIKDYEVLVAIEVFSEVGGFLNGHITNAYIDPTTTVNMTSDHGDVTTYSPVKVFDNKGFNHGSNYCYYSQSGNCTFSENLVGAPNGTVDKDTLVFISDFFPVDAVKPIVFGVGLINQEYQYDNGTFMIDDVLLVDGFDLTNLKLRLKITLNATHDAQNEDGSDITSSFTFTYDIDDSNIDWQSSPLVSNLQYSALNISQFKENLSFTDVNFDGSAVDGCKLVGTHYTCQAWNDVSINGNLTTSSGHTVDIMAGNIIEEFPESTVNPEIVLSINPILDYSQPNPTTDLDFVKKYCNNDLGEGMPGYNANSVNKSKITEFIENTPQKPEDLAKPLLPLEANVYPVPTDSRLNLAFNQQITNETIAIVDLSGRTIECPIEKLDTWRFNIDVSRLSPGSYYIILNSNEGSVTKLFTVTANK